MKDFWLPKVFSKTILFLLFATGLALFLYLLGNYQDFIDVSQRFLVTVLEYTSLLSAIFCLYFFIAKLYEIIFRKGRGYISVILSLIGCAVTAFIYLGTKFLFAFTYPY